MTAPLSPITALHAMLAESQRAPEPHQPSRFWEDHAAVHVRQLEDHGFERFKRTVNQHYFNWITPWPDDQFRRVLGHWLRRPDPAVLRARLIDSSAPIENGIERLGALRRPDARARYLVYVTLLWEYAHSRDALGLLDDLEEPALGEPIQVRHRGLRITQDLGNSGLELNRIVQATGMIDLAGRTVLEVGAGYGRLVWLIAQHWADARIVVCDIPPALAVAQWYLTTLFPQRRAFHFRPFADGDEVAEELASAQLAFLMPHQLELLPSLKADLAINISSMGEMRPDQIARWFELLDRHTSGVFFSKQWKASHNRHDEVTITMHDYPVPASWDVLALRDSPIQRRFFEAAYRVA
jgi:putative sugar O-methyltransferase